jgi:hypothetical protein
MLWPRRGDGDTHKDCHPHSHQDLNSHKYSNPDGQHDTHSHQDHNSHRYSNPNTEHDAHSYCNSQPHRHPNPDGHPDIHTDQDSDLHPNPDRHKRSGQPLHAYIHQHSHPGWCVAQDLLALRSSLNRGFI